jgi:hypothetical protein
MAICVRPTAPTPNIFPSIISQGRTDDIITSTTLELFSSSTARTISWP